MDQQDTFSNFVVTGDLLDPMTVSVLNTTDFNFFKFLEGYTHILLSGVKLVTDTNNSYSPCFHYQQYTSILILVRI